MNKKIKTMTIIIIFILLAGVMLLTTNDSSAQIKKQTFAGIEMVLLPAGKVPSFWIGKYEVTQKQYEDVIGTNPSGFKGKQNNPVEKVSWYDAVEFCNKLSIKTGFKPYYTIDKNKSDPNNKNDGDFTKWTVTINKGSNGFRLPTSAEWEYAYRAGTKTTYYWGESNDFKVIDQYAVYDENSFKKGENHKDYGTHKAGSKKPNAWELYDMSGNVWEWCYDWSSGGEIGYNRMLLGGSWKNNTVYFKISIHSEYGYPDYRSESIGFRLAKNK